MSRMTSEEIRANWEHCLVGEKHTYTLQAGSDLVRVERRHNAAQSGVREVDSIDDLVPIEDLRGVLAEWDAMIGTEEKKS